MNRLTESEKRDLLDEKLNLEVINLRLENIKLKLEIEKLIKNCCGYEELKKYL